MKIENLIKQLGYNFQSDVEIDNLAIDSHLINEKSLFIALKGEHFDAYNLINEQLLSKVGFVFTYKYYLCKAFKNTHHSHDPLFQEIFASLPFAIGYGCTHHGRPIRCYPQRFRR